MSALNSSSPIKPYFDFTKDHATFFPSARLAETSLDSPPIALTLPFDNISEFSDDFEFHYNLSSPLSDPLPKRTKSSEPSEACTPPPLLPVKAVFWSIECRCRLLDLASNPDIRDNFLTEVRIDEFAQELLKHYGIRYSSQEVQNELIQLQSHYPKIFLDFETAFSKKTLSKISTTRITKDSLWNTESRCYLLQIAHKEPGFKRNFNEISLFLSYKTGLLFSEKQLASQLVVMERKLPLL